jgi:SAM-dependent methyltransferase
MTSSLPDPDSLRYAEHWEPVLAGPSQRLLARVAGLAGPRLAGDRHSLTVLDLGAGTGALALAAAERWPAARIVCLDASAGMLSVARQRAESQHAGRHAERFEWLVADAAAVPIEPGTVDVVVSSFMLQLVADRRAVLREAHRVLRPGGLLGLVTWQADDLVMAADTEFDEAVYDLEIDEPAAEPLEPASGDVASPGEAEDDLRAAGFEDVDVRVDRLEHSWTRQGYLDFKAAYDERELCESLSPADRARLLARVRERWAALPEEDFTLRAPLISATARRSDG